MSHAIFQTYCHPEREREREQAKSGNTHIPVIVFLNTENDLFVNSQIRQNHIQNKVK